MNRKKTIIAVSSAVVAFAVAAGVVFMNREKPEEPVAENSETVAETTTAETTVPETLPETEPVTTFPPFVNGLSQKASEYWQQNHDTVGWIRIKDSMIDYPITRSTDNDYYIERDFYGNRDSAGWVFMDFRCGIESDYFTDNSLIYGHNMASGVMFSDLKNYERYESYYESHPIVEVSSLTTDYQYKVFAYMACDGAKGSDFEFWNYIFFPDEQESSWSLREYLRRIDQKSMVTTNVDVRDDDKFLALSTCYGGDTTDSTRFVVLARMVRPGEDALAGTEGSVRRY